MKIFIFLLRLFGWLKDKWDNWFYHTIRKMLGLID